MSLKNTILLGTLATPFLETNVHAQRDFFPALLVGVLQASVGSCAFHNGINTATLARDSSLDDIYIATMGHDSICTYRHSKRSILRIIRSFDCWFVVDQARSQFKGSQT